MGWFSSSAPTPATPQASSPASSPPQLTNLASDLKQSPDESTQKPKPCCVCKDEKAARDECMLFSKADDPQEDCKGMVGRYRDCMKGFGFRI